MNFQTGKHLKTIRHCGFLHTMYKRIGYVVIIILNHIFQVVKVQTLVVAVLAQSFAAMIAVVAAHVVAGDRSTVTGAFNKHLYGTRSSR